MLLKNGKHKRFMKPLDGEFEIVSDNFNQLMDKLNADKSYYQKTKKNFI